MPRRLGYAALALAALASAAAGVVPQLGLPTDPLVGELTLTTALVRGLGGLAVVAAAYGGYALADAFLAASSASRRRRHDLHGLLQLAFGAAAVVGLLGVLTEQWVGVLVSLGVVGFAVTFALQQPLFSLIGWTYIMIKRPYQVGDRVAIEGSAGDVVAVDFLVTTLWETGGIVASNQPSGRTITLPNSVVLSSHVANYTREEFPYVWNELTVEVAYETDLAFAAELLAGTADDYLGDAMADRIADYRNRLAETPVELSVADRPTVNVVQQSSWVELRVRYLVDPRQGQRVRNDLYERSLARLNDHPDRVAFPVGRNR